MPKSPGRTRKPRVNHEAGEQRVLVNWLEMRGVKFFATINGAYFGGDPRNIRGRAAHAAKLKAMGWRAGVPDLILLDQWHDPELGHARPVAVEMKRADGGRISAEQLTMHEQMAERGWVVLVCNGAYAAIAELGRMGF